MKEIIEKTSINYGTSLNESKIKFTTGGNSSKALNSSQKVNHNEEMCNESNEVQSKRIPNSSMKSKLAILSERINGFEKQMENETRQRRESEEIRISAIREAINKLEKTLSAEIKRRVEASKALQDMFENQVATVQDKLENTFGDKISNLQKVANTLSDRIDQAEKEFILEKEKFQQETEYRQEGLSKDLTILQGLLENEKLNRQEREAQLIKRFGDLEGELDHRLEISKNFREQKYENILQEFEKSKFQREKIEEDFYSNLLEEVAGIKNALVLESQARENADDDIVLAVNHYTKALQDALRLVSTS